MEDHSSRALGIIGCAIRLAESNHRHLVTVLDDSGAVVVERAFDTEVASEAVTTFAEDDVGPGTLVVSSRDDPGDPEPFDDADALRAAADLVLGCAFAAWVICDDTGFGVCIPPRS